MSKLHLIFIVLASINLGIAIYTLNLAAVCGWLSALCMGLQILIPQGD